MNEKDEKDEKNDVDLASFNTARKVNSSEYRQSYNAKRDRSKYDDVQKRKAFKEEQYGNKKTIKDPYTGKDLHRNGNAALNKYGEKHVNEHKSQTDHTISLEKVVNKMLFGLRDSMNEQAFLECVAGLEKTYEK